jgi:CubicO group peptidase (beta-lactamase class C family)
MKVRQLLLIAVILLASCAQSSIEERITRVESGLLSDYSDSSSQGMHILDRMQHYNVPGVSIAVINDYQVEWVKGYGVLEAGGNEPVTPQTLFQAASIGKPVVAAAALQLVEQDLLDLDTDVNQSLESWQIPGNKYTAEEKVTLRRLLSHSGGVNVEGFRGYALGEDIPDLQQILDGLPPANSAPVRVFLLPGSEQRYSGGGYMIVQQLIEDITGETFARTMQQNVFELLGMDASTFEYPLPGPLEPNAASGHRIDSSPIPGGWHTYPEMGSGASLWSTPTDLANFAIALMNSYRGQPGGVLSQAMTQEMLTPQIDSRGLGPVVLDEGGDKFYFLHPGANDGFQSYWFAYPERGQGAVIMTNSDNGEALYDEIKRSLSIEYGWVQDNTNLYIGIALAVVVVFSGLLLIRWIRGRRRSA